MNDVIVEYGGALSDLAFEENREDAVLESARVVKQVLADTPEYIKFLSAPNIAIGEKLSAIDEAFGGVDAYVKNFVKIMVERGYASSIIDCFDEFMRLYYAKKNISVAKVLSATELSEEQKTALKAKLEKKTGKHVELECVLSPEIIGGIRILIDGELFDGSVKGRLDGMREQLAKTTI